MLNHIIKKFIVFCLTIFCTSFAMAGTWPTCPSNSILSATSIPTVEPDPDNPNFGWAGFGPLAYNMQTWLVGVFFVPAPDPSTARSKIKQALSTISGTPILYKSFDFNGDCSSGTDCSIKYVCVYHTSSDPHTLIYAVNIPDRNYLKAQIKLLQPE